MYNRANARLANLDMLDVSKKFLGKTFLSSGTLCKMLYLRSKPWWVLLSFFFFVIFGTKSSQP